ncbi:MAG: DUF1553 domain-containing protein [Planctomycetes bacterium]|nr:DUF1553 domain-containing protein [Planctomycetota bacterium]
MKSIQILLVEILFLAACKGVGASDRLEFNRDVRPILSDNCFYCHGPDANHRQADLRLDIRESAVAHKAITPENSDLSGLVQRVSSSDPEHLMPPPTSNKKLSERDKEILKRWIAEGAEYQQHWSFEKPVKPAVPPGSSAIDFLIAKRHSELDYTTASEADRRVLIRRLYFDLIGLPPTPQEVEEFIGDRSDNAYEKLVDRLIQNPHYGERMAIGWLDVVRFADTIGYHSDNPRNIWPYRDWVIRSFNSNKSFDRFTLEQIAGDLLPDANQETLVGSAFNRLLLTTEEGGAQAKDYEQRMLTDRVRAIGAAWLGLTTGCAQCHDHKFDPFTTRDFYALGAFFADIDEGLVGPREEGMPVPTATQRERLAALDADLEKAKAVFDTIADEINAAQKEWEDSVRTDPSLFEAIQSEPDGRQADKKVKRNVLAAIQSDKPSEAQKQEIRRFYREYVHTSHREGWKAFETAEQARSEFYRQIPKCLVSKSTSKKRTVRILPRGNWLDESGEVMHPAFPSYLPQPVPEGREWNRLDLAGWLVSRENPLTARVVTNRLWKNFFGTGLSKILDDLGAQGEPPIHAELLDYLACEFMDSGWDWNHMVRLIVTSRTYRQSSVGTAEQMAADPYNREYARQSTFRLDAELIRDQSLYVSGLLASEIGGPSVKPYQPAGYWENLNFPTRTYEEDRGSAQHRRGLYTWWQRSFLHPSLLAFDAPSREECCAERTRSNIPQQALVLMNDPTYVEAARALAGRILEQSYNSDESRIEWAFQQVLQRKPSRTEIETLSQLLKQHRERYSSDAVAAGKLLAVGIAPNPRDFEPSSLAAWTHVARVLLCLHETITRS